LVAGGWWLVINGNLLVTDHQPPATNHRIDVIKQGLYNVRRVA